MRCGVATCSTERKGLQPVRITVSLCSTVPPRSLLLLEDIDSAIRRSESAEGDDRTADGPALTQLTLNPYGARSITFSGLLNALDGVCTFLLLQLPLLFHKMHAKNPSG